MSSSRKSLNSCVNWSRLLEQLELSASPTQALPAAATCPRCKRNHLVILADQADGGQWHWCRGCGENGDMIELAAKTWRRGLTSTIDRLRRSGFEIPFDDGAVARYRKHYVEHRKRDRDLWSAAKANVGNPGRDAQRVMHRLQLPRPKEGERWLEGGGQIMGWLPCREIERLLFEIPGASEDGPRETLRRRIFVGRRWRDALVFPQYDLPGRISSFLFVGRDADPEVDWIALPRPAGGVERTPGDYCGGVGFHPKLLAEDSPCVVIVSDPSLAYRMQAKHSRVSGKMLPMASYVDRHPLRTRNSWRLFGGRDLVFWSPFNACSAFRQAIMADGLVSLCGPRDATSKTFGHLLTMYGTHDLHRRIISLARPWPEAMSRYFRDRDDAEIQEFYSHLRMENIDITQMVARLPEMDQERFGALQHDACGGRSLPVQGRQILEKNDGWYLSRKGSPDELVLGGLLRIDCVIQHQRAGETYYQGRFVFQGHSLEFTAPLTAFDKNPFEWLKQFVLQQGLGFLSYANAWSKHAVHVATQLSPPRFVLGADYVGYDFEKEEISLPSCAVEMGGRVREHPRVSLSAPLPGRNLPKPPNISPAELDSVDSPTTMAVFLCVLANVLAPAFNQPRRAIGLLGPGASSAGREVALALDCQQIRPRSPKAVEAALAAESRHGWPTLVDLPAYGKIASSWADPEQVALEERDAIVSLDRRHFHLRKLLGGWFLIEDMDSLRASEARRANLPRIASAYFGDVMRRRLSVTHLECWLTSIADDFADFVRRSHGDAGVVKQATLLAAPRGAVDQVRGLADLISEFVVEGKLSWASASESARLDDRLTKEDSESGKITTIPKHEVKRLLQATRGLNLPLEQTSAILAQADLLIEDRQACWTTPSEWWDKHWRLTEAEKSGRLRLSG